MGSNEFGIIERITEINDFIHKYQLLNKQYVIYIFNKQYSS